VNVSFAVIGKNIRQARKRSGITQEKFADLIGISVLHYGRLERGERSVSLTQLGKIAGLLNTSIEDLLSGCTDALPGEVPKKKENLGLIIQSLSSGCSERACALMLDVCLAIASNDKFYPV